MSIESDDDLRALQAAGRVVVALAAMEQAAAAGVTTAEVDEAGASC